MVEPALSLFAWWEISISWSIVFLIVTGLALYVSSRPKHKRDRREEKKQEINENKASGHADKVQLRARAVRIAKDFIFVWVLLALLVFYIFSVQLGTGSLSQVVFALGNVFVEALLVVYLFRNSDRPRRERGKDSKEHNVSSTNEAPTVNKAPT